MEYEDRRTISTPEGVDLELPLAGLGSRFIGLLLDTGIQAAGITLAVLAFEQAGSTLGVVVFSSGAVLVIIAYDVIFEVAGGGRTPGKRASGVRVVMDAGGAGRRRGGLVRQIHRPLRGR